MFISHIGFILLLVVAKDSNAEFHEYDLLVSQLKGIEKTTLYEGLPHPTFEGPLLADELSKKKTTKIDGHHFYGTPIDVGPEDEKAILALLTDPLSVSKTTEEKACGGFHPDFCIRMELRSGKRIRFLICFGCHEMVCISGEESINCDLREESYKALTSLLWKHGRERPKK